MPLGDNGDNCYESWRCKDLDEEKFRFHNVATFCRIIHRSQNSPNSWSCILILKPDWGTWVMCMWKLAAPVSSLRLQTHKVKISTLKPCLGQWMFPIRARFFKRNEKSSQSSWQPFYQHWSFAHCKVYIKSIMIPPSLQPKRRRQLDPWT